jgi:hypothetical protein
LPHNPTDYRPLMRGLVMALESWAREGREPPPSRFPRIADATLADWHVTSSGWRSLTGVSYPEVIHAPQFCDYGPMFLTHRRVTLHPPVVQGAYRVLVPACGEDNNERGMLQLPTVAVPVATFTGWNLRAPAIGAPTELLALAGGYIPFARAPRDRRAPDDPRPAILDRYADFDDYLSRYRALVDELISDRYILPEDEAGLIELAHKHGGVFEE